MLEYVDVMDSPTCQSITRPSRIVKVSRYDSEGPNISWANKEEGEKAEGTLSTLESAFSNIIQAVGDSDPNRDALKKTPHRAAKALLYFTKGYEEDLQSELSSHLLRICFFLWNQTGRYS